MSNENPLVVSYLTLRKLIGWVGMLMPLIVRIGARVLPPHIWTTDSISAYYYTGMRDVFVSTLVLVGALLFCYRAPGVFDTMLTIVAGLAAIGIGLFPMAPGFAPEIKQQFPQMNDQTCYYMAGPVGFHHYFVVGFFLLAIVMVWRFTAFTAPNPTREKIRRNWIYRICAVAMALACVIIAFLGFSKSGSKIFWPETVAVVAFGVAWLIKGQTILKDPAQAIE
jgi:hypothetical protein